MSRGRVGFDGRRVLIYREINLSSKKKGGGGGGHGEKELFHTGPAD